MRALASSSPPSLRVYRAIQRFPFGRSYVLRLMALCFVGTHVPLVALTLYVTSAGLGGLRAHAPILLVVLAATLLGTVCTLAALRSALKPVLLSASALRAYVARRTLPDLPLDGCDEAGELMAAVRTVCEQLEHELARQERLAATDALTGLLNRRSFFERATRELTAGRDARQELALAVFDIDHFKQINDTWGHAAGDAVIVAVAGALQAQAGPGGLVARLGGEEFALLWRRSGERSALARAEGVRAAVAALRVAGLENRPVSVSGGVVVVDPLQEATIDRALERADHALYAAKEGGRDCVRLAMS